jgi:hypothetical protein
MNEEKEKTETCSKNRLVFKQGVTRTTTTAKIEIERNKQN